MGKVSPMMQQYLDIKESHQDSILFFRLGDFYEMFFEDAKLVSEELDLTLTGKDYGQEERAPMCGIPYHSCEAYMARLIAKGYKISVCEQVENPAEARGLVKRDVVRVMTPGTIIENDMLDESKNNYICCVYSSDVMPMTGMCFCDVSTGELKVTELYGKDEDLTNQIKSELGRFNPIEILFVTRPEVYKPLSNFMREKLRCCVDVLKDKFNNKQAEEYMLEHFKLKNLKEIKLEYKICPIKSIVYLLEYLKSTQKNNLNNISSPVYYNKEEYMGLDLNTIRNLELLETMRTGSKKGSLLGVIDKTKTAMGKRLLRSWIERPLINKTQILLRQNSVEELADNCILRNNLTKILAGIHDIQRLMTKITYNSANARDLKSFSSAISYLPDLKLLLQNTNSELLQDNYNNLDTLEDICELIDQAICDEPPVSIKEGGIIKDGYNKQVDEYRTDMYSGEDLIRNIEQKERDNTGITKLKVTHNKIFGYYIEVTNSFKNMVPENYIRKQTLANCERYTTEELKQLESRIFNAREKINETEYKIFDEVRKKVAENFTRVINTSNIIAVIDILRSFAEIASSNNYIKPEIQDPGVINIKQGKHPVVESLIKSTDFVPNDLILDNNQNNVAIITGPNMAGKSTYMRQTALIVLLAQIGSFVPASSATIGIVDNIFTRIGASDDLASGQSTFMVEMNEVADIIKNSTQKSLLILDEIGRGTSTFDGMSIAQAVLEFVADKNKLGAKTLFATHYHELTSITQEFDNIKNYNIAVKKDHDNITFLRTIIPGAADDSYGIEVAKLAGLPEHIISRAKEILYNLENNLYQNLNNNQTNLQNNQNNQTQQDPNQILCEQIIQELKQVDLNTLMPIDSMNILHKLVNLVKT